jgi:hypothetical protein
MTMRQTPFQRIRYPWASDVVNAADVDSMGADIDQALVNTANLANDFSKYSTVVAKRVAAQSITKNTLTALTFDSVIDNGANSPVANGAWWSASNPTRLTAPVSCVVMAIATGGVNATSAFGTPAALQVTVALNGASGLPGVQGSKYGPFSTQTGQVWGSAMTVWSLTKGDYLEFKIYWVGTPAGPFNTDTALPPTLSLAMVALPAVP